MAGPLTQAIVSETPTPSDPESPPVEPPNRSDDEVLPLPTWRRWIILLIISWMPIPMNFAVSSIFAVAPEVAAGLSVSESVISAANSGVFLAMAVSPLFWVPLVKLIGRRLSYIAGAVLLSVCSVGQVFVGDVVGFVALWALSGATAVIFLCAGQTIITDVFEPTTRGTASGIFSAISVSSQMIAPMTGGILVAHTSWRVIYAVQAGMAVFGLIMSVIFIPQEKEGTSEDSVSPKTFWTRMQVFSPVPILRLFGERDVFYLSCTCGLVAYGLYGLLSAIRFSINGQQGSNSPQTSGLFYIAPGIGFLLGSLAGGWLSDRTVQQYLKKRNGVRIPSDRLRDAFRAAYLVTPVGTILFGWSLQKHAGGLYLPGVAAFLAGTGYMATFAVVNTYAAEIDPLKKNQIVSAKYIVQYAMAAVAIATRMPAMKAIGLGLTFTIDTVVTMVAALTIAIPMYRWRQSRGRS